MATLDSSIRHRSKPERFISSDDLADAAGVRDSFVDSFLELASKKDFHFRCHAAL